ncbi:MAG: HlyD family efflux transporter periplasmic adaptor subunit [Desulfosarcina sp.]|nr:HlyD family efflux transporter periplasmic adaptor subunit [Desulfosarcina sp.]
MGVTGKRIAADDPKASQFSGVKAIAEWLAQQNTPGEFLGALLAAQCRQTHADAAAILRSGPADRTEVLAAYPPPLNPGSLPGWIGKADKPVRKAIKSGRTVTVRQDAASTGDAPSKRYLMVVPIQNQGVVRAAAAFRIRVQRPHELLLSHARLETTPLLVDHHELQLTANMHLETMNRLRRVMEVLDAINRPTRFLEAAMALCNEIAAWLGCNRVSIGLLAGRCVQVRAMSHTDTFNREMQVVQAIEAAMEECLDQDLEIVHPATEPAIAASRAAARLSEQHGPSAVLSLPIRQAGDVSAVVTLERPVEQPFDRLEEIEAMRLTVDLCAPRLLSLHRSDRWVGARMASDARQHVGLLLGHQHTGMKLAAVLVALAGIFLATLNGEYRINTTFALKAQHQQVVVAPFDTFSKSVQVEPGDRVEGGKTILGTLETAELRLKLAALKAEQLGYQKQMTSSMRDRKTVDAHIAASQSERVAAQIQMIERNIQQADLVAPIDGWVISKDRKQEIGAPVGAGEILFEVASIDSLRAELFVPETSIAGVADGQAGTMAAVGHPDQKVRFVIERIHPIAEVVDHQNVFRVRARIIDQLEWMRPGMEGEARISAGRKTYLWIATHRLVDWLRMRLWI